MTVFNGYYSTKVKQENEDRRRKTLVTVLRTVVSLAIPATISLVVSVFCTFAMHMNDNASYFYNAWYLFCKLFFPCVPLMMRFILK